MSQVTLSILAWSIVAITFDAGLALDWAINEIQCYDPNKDPLNLFTPYSNVTSYSKTYRIEYYNPLALDLNGDGVIITTVEAN